MSDQSTPDPTGHDDDAAPKTAVGAHLGEREREGVIDLLGVIAYGSISGFTRMAADSEMADDMHLKTALAGMAVKEFTNYELLVSHIVDLGGDPWEAMTPFKEAFDAYHARTKPRDVLEGLVKAYIGDGIAYDFFREIARFVDDESRSIIEQASGDDGRTEVIVGAVREAIHQERTLAGPLALWGRRLVGEALSQGQLVAVERDALSELILGTSHDRPGAGLEEIGQIMTRLTDAHQKRMGNLGLIA